MWSPLSGQLPYSICAWSMYVVGMSIKYPLLQRVIRGVNL